MIHILKGQHPFIRKKPLGGGEGEGGPCVSHGVTDAKSLVIATCVMLIF